MQATHDRQQHKQDVHSFLQERIASGPWELTVPAGHGGETYTARSDSLACFVKLTPLASRYEAMAALGLTPPVLAADSLADGTPVLVQSYVAGHAPSGREFRLHMRKFAEVVQLMHQSSQLRGILPDPSSELFRDAAMRALGRVRERWEQFKDSVPDAVPFVDASLDEIEETARGFVGSGLVACHHDICNVNWLLTPEGHPYLVDLDLMALDDPAADLGTLLWWYYPPEDRKAFLAAAGYGSEPTILDRMRTRMAVHCLSIELPRAQSFDEFDPAAFPDALVDFRAVMAREQNPQGYDD